MYIEKQDFDKEQRKHDGRAKEMQLIRQSLDMNLLTNKQAWEDFKNVYLNKY